MPFILVGTIITNARTPNDNATCVVDGGGIEDDMVNNGCRTLPVPFLSVDPPPLNYSKSHFRPLFNRIAKMVFFNFIYFGINQTTVLLLEVEVDPVCSK